MKISKLSSILALGAVSAMPLAARAGNVSGAVSFTGEAPKRTVVKMDADPKCAAIHGDKKVGSEDAIVSKDGKVANVFVYLKEGVKGKFTPPTTPGEIDQNGCMYSPHVQGVMVDQPFNIKNSDPTLHNIHCLAKVNPEFNFGQPQPGTKDKVFRKAEAPVKFKCDVHPWMSAYVFVMEHPFFGVSGKDGGFTIKDVPDGEYTLAAWHEKFGEQTAKIKVAGGELKDQNITFSAAEKK